MSRSGQGPGVGGERVGDRRAGATLRASLPTHSLGTPPEGWLKESGTYFTEQRLCLVALVRVPLGDSAVSLSRIQNGSAQTAAVEQWQQPAIIESVFYSKQVPGIAHSSNFPWRRNS